MLFKKTMQHGQYGNIRFIQGAVKFQSFQLSVYCFETDGVMIDTSAKSLFPLTKSFFDTIDVDKVVLTHHHEDHTGGVHYFTNKKIPIYMHEKSIEEVKRRATYPMYRKLFWGTRKPFEANPLEDTFESRNAVWDVIETPGHTSDHLSFLNRETGMLFTGDLFVSPKTKVILKNESIPEIMRSLQRVLTYDFEEVVCHHAGIVVNGREALQQKYENLYEFSNQVLRLYNGGMDIQHIHQQLFPKKYPIQTFSQGEWHSLHMVTSVVNDSFIKERVQDGQAI